MSAIIHLMGRVTKDPVMQQGRNNGTEYISLDLATSQRSQNAQNNPENPYESVFYQCYLNKHLAERLIRTIGSAQHHKLKEKFRIQKKTGQR